MVLQLQEVAVRTEDLLVLPGHPLGGVEVAGDDRLGQLASEAAGEADQAVGVLGEELLFRGLLLPRMKGVFGKYDWVANGVLFAIYHLHQPWTIPTALVDIFALAYPSRRFQSAWMGIIVHSTQSVFFFIVLLTLVAK